jgi:hypothetical protein
VSYIFHYDLPAVADPGDELAIQVRLKARCKMLAPTMRLVAVPNGGKRTAFAAGRAKAEGLSKGFCDLIAMGPGGQVAFLEIKQKSGSLSVEQTDWLNWLHNQGFNCGVFRSVQTAVDALIVWGFPFVNQETRHAA